METLQKSKLPLLLRDLATGLNQQMFFWGRDVLHADGCLFIRSGFEKRPSTGIQGTSCYRLPWQDGAIELHGSHAGWISEDGGAFFFRPIGRCVRWLTPEAPVPGRWKPNEYDAQQNQQLHEALLPFLDWWLAHEDQVKRAAGPAYRQACYRAYKKLPRTRAWLEPQAAVQWVTALRDHPEELVRAKRFA